MSEFQSVHFLAVDRPLDDKQLAFMETQSTRAEISRWEFFNEYEWGDFRGDPLKMLRRGYDVHLHYANFGIRRLMVRLPGGMPCDDELLAEFLVDDCVSWYADKPGKGSIWHIEPEADAGTFGEDLYDVAELFHKIAPLRELLIAGDLRPLYVAWLACAFGDDTPEPPVPAGLKKLPSSLEALAELYEVDSDLLAAAAENSPAIPVTAEADEPIAAWLSGQKPDELRELAARLLGADAAGCRAETLSRIRDETSRPTWPVAEPSRTLGQLRERAKQLANIRGGREQKARETARRKRLAGLAANPRKAEAAIDALVQTRSTSSYLQAAQDLADLCEALGPEAGPQQARAIAARIRRDNPKRSGLVAALRKQDLVD